MFIPAVVVGTDKVGIMASQTLEISGLSDYFMADQLAVAESHVAGGTTGSSLCIGVSVARRIEMAAEAASS